MRYDSTVPTFNSCTKCVGGLGKIRDRMPDCHPVSWAMDAWMTSQLNVVLIHKLCESLICMAKKLFFMDVYTNRHRRASGRLVHELNVCTVYGVDHCTSNYNHRLTQSHCQFLTCLDRDSRLCLQWRQISYNSLAFLNHLAGYLLHNPNSICNRGFRQ